MIKKSFYVHNIKISINTNSKLLFKLINSCLESLTFRPKTHSNTSLNFKLLQLDSYNQIPRDGTTYMYSAYPIMQKEYINGEKLILEVNPRTIHVNIYPKKNAAVGYIASPEIIEEDLLLDLIFFQPLKTLLKFHNLFLLHASAVAYNDRCILFAGDTGSGKSTLALNLVKSGFSYLADDDVILKEENKGIVCLAFPTKIKIKESNLRFFPEYRHKIEKVFGGKNKHMLNLNEINPEITVNKAVPDLLMFPCYRSGVAKARTELMPKMQALSRLMDGNYSTYKHKDYLRISKSHLQALSDLVMQCTAYKLYYSDQKLKDIPALVEGIL